MTISVDNLASSYMSLEEYKIQAIGGGYILNLNGLPLILVLVFGQLQSQNIQHEIKWSQKTEGLFMSESYRKQFREHRIPIMVCLQILDITSYANTLKLERGFNIHTNNTRYDMQRNHTTCHLFFFKRSHSMLEPNS